MEMLSAPEKDGRLRLKSVTYIESVLAFSVIQKLSEPWR
jgi:hypothetical protein